MRQEAKEYLFPLGNRLYIRLGLYSRAITFFLIVILLHELQFTLKLQKHNNTFTYLHVTTYML